ncbi:hypothetical protein ACIBSW_27010 [Actinoplanes sp. NPDC049668]|uniref:hypothetical protein n=1 Tax=unclassified Actinoplanes TaxID=2626549 RepID=UPI0033A4F50A
MDAYTIWRCLPFPQSGSSPALTAAHSDLAEADEYVTTVIRFVERGIYMPAPVDVLVLLQDVLRQTDRLGDDASANDREVARLQHAYAALLELVYREFLQAAPSGD